METGVGGPRPRPSPCRAQGGCWTPTLVITSSNAKSLESEEGLPGGLACLRLESFQQVEGSRLGPPGIPINKLRSLPAMDVSIAELARILEVRRAGVCNCSVLKDSIAAKIKSINLRFDKLTAMKAELGRLLGSWQGCAVA